MFISESPERSWTACKDMIAFTDVVSLGYNCRTTHRLREHFATRRAFPLDWWVTPLKGAVNFLRDWDLERLYDPQHLCEIAGDDQVAYIENALYGIKLQHEFPLGEGKLGVLPGWRDHIEQAKSRTRFLMDRFDGLNERGNRILFVRELGPDERRAPQLCIYLKQLIRGRLPLARCVFLLISADGMSVQGWHALKVDDPTIVPWWGNPQIWDRALSSLGFEVTAAAREPSAETLITAMPKFENESEQSGVSD